MGSHCVMVCSKTSKRVLGDVFQTAFCDHGKSQSMTTSLWAKVGKLI